MSNVGQIALDVVGLALSIVLMNPLPLVIAMAAGQLLFPTQLPNGPQMGDNRTTTSNVGDPVALVFGTAPVAGTVMWLAPYVQSSSGGKGGSNQKTYQYNQSIAIGLCEGPIGGITRIWENGAIVYDVRPILQANADLNRLAETTDEYNSRMSVSATYAETFVLYLGTETQEADPTIEATQGYGTVPAFRGLAYIVYPNRLLQTSQAWRHPNFKFEIYQPPPTTVSYANEVLYPWVQGGADPRNPLNNHFYFYGGIGEQQPGTLCSSIDAALAAAPVTISDHLLGYTLPSSGQFGHDGTFPETPVPNNASQDPVDLALHFNSMPVTVQNWLSYQTAFFAGTADSMADFLSQQTHDANGRLWWSTGDASLANHFSVPPGVYFADSTLSGPFITQPLFLVGSAWRCNQDVLVTCWRAPGAPVGGYTLDERPYRVLQGFRTANSWPPGYTSYVPTTANDKVLTLPLGPALPAGDPNDTEAFWTAAYNAAVAAGTMPAGLHYKLVGDTDYQMDHYPVNQDHGYMKTSVGAPASNVSLATIIETMCTRAGLSAIDASDMANVYLDGYSIASLSSGAAILTPLRSVGFFDAIETGGILKFAARGKASVATFTTDDFGAYDASAGKQKTVPPSITTVRTQDEELPRMIRLRYHATALDYEDSEQLSPYRIQSSAVNDTDVSLPVCMSDTAALRCAEVLWSDAWAGRAAYTLSVDQAWLALDCGDCIDVPVDGVLQRMRIASDSNASGILRKLSCVRDDGDSYVSTAIAQPRQTPPQTLKLIAPTSYELLDLPALQDADNDPGFYVAAQRMDGAGTGWQGCTVYESSNGGSTYSPLFSIVSEAVAGTIAAAVPASQCYTWDTVTTITVTVPEDFSFESLTDAVVIAGGNAAAMGADGRWEVLQFATATKVSTTTWQLSRLLRGRRGTEHVCGSSTDGDTFVLLAPNALGRVVLQQAEIGASLPYKGVSIGATFGSGIDASFAGHAEALVPFSPVHVAAARQTNGDIALSWIRRGRLGRTLMDGTDIPLSEESEAYAIDVLSGSTVLRTLSASSPAATYSAAMQALDFGAVPSTLHVAVYQLSAIVGRGTAANATLAV